MTDQPVHISGLYTDFYELSMAQGYFYAGKHKETAVFDYFFRTNPFKGGFLVFAGLADFLNQLQSFTYEAESIDYLQKLGLKPEFLEYLSHFRFKGKIFSVREGELVFPNEPIVRVEASLPEAQLIETLLLNILNFQSLIATKSFRMKLAANGKNFSDFGLRRSHGFGGLMASRAAIIGGASSTSNAQAGFMYGLPVSGTMAHSWVQGFEDELTAFRTYAKFNPKNSILLVDTYDTLRSGLPNAILVAKEMEAEEEKLAGIRLDSGDLAYLSKKARKMLDKEGLNYVRILVSNQLNEWVISSLEDQGAPIDGFGIGTELVTGKPDASLDGVYKLCESAGNPSMKISENIEKNTLPGKKMLWRFYDEEGNIYLDGIFLDNELPENCDWLYHPVQPDKKTAIAYLKKEQLLQPVYENGILVRPLPTPSECHQYLTQRAELLPEEHKRFVMPHIFKVGVSAGLLELRKEVMQKYRKSYEG
ncbi:MAG: nicotinate phosphoribosyltransferase [Prolixibacteraceae bacterium]|nr:nicotinate phosphoribosyltransferase [Prolixibacteraceae bacterium]